MSTLREGALSYATRPKGPTDTARPNPTALGFVDILDPEGNLKISFWATHLLTAHRVDNDTGTQLTFQRHDWWLPTTCLPADIMSAIGAAMAAHTAQEERAAR